MNAGDTIVALSTPAAPSARIILRLSGPQSWPLALALCPNAELVAARPVRSVASFHRLDVPVTLYPFRAPRSYTGEDLIEFHVPGNPLLAQLLLDELLSRGARSAEAGEFTARAYFHGRLDLTEAEGVAATIAAQNESELKAARQLLAGELARRVKPAMELVADTLALTEVGIDFTEEDVSFLSGEETAARIARVDALLAELVAQSARFEKLSHEPRTVLVGRPNAGKSTLLNALAGRERAVVSPVAGTTRDALSADVALPRGMVRLIDVAGLEESSAPLSAAAQSIEEQMRARALGELESADLVLLVHDSTSAEEVLEIPRKHDVLVLTKGDLPPATGDLPSAVVVSAHTGENLDILRERLDQLAFGPASASSALALNTRHVQAIAAARAALSRAAGNAGGTAELLAFDLREALDALGSILGSISPDELLGRIFSAFCIGK